METDTARQLLDVMYSQRESLLKQRAEAREKLQLAELRLAEIEGDLLKLNDDISTWLERFA